MIFEIFIVEILLEYETSIDSRFNYYRIHFDHENTQSSGYIRSDTFFKHPDFSHDNFCDIGLIKLEGEFERSESIYETHRVVNIICLPVRGFSLKGEQIATIAGSGPGLDRVKTGSTRVKEIPDYHLNREHNDFEFMTCEVSSLSPINLVQLINFFS